MLKNILMKFKDPLTIRGRFGEYLRRFWGSFYGLGPLLGKTKATLNKSGIPFNFSGLVAANELIFDLLKCILSSQLTLTSTFWLNYEYKYTTSRFHLLVRTYSFRIWLSVINSQRHSVFAFKLRPWLGNYPCLRELIFYYSLICLVVEFAFQFDGNPESLIWKSWDGIGNEIWRISPLHVTIDLALTLLYREHLGILWRMRNFYYSIFYEFTQTISIFRKLIHWKTNSYSLCLFLIWNNVV